MANNTDLEITSAPSRLVENDAADFPPGTILLEDGK